MKKYIAIIMAVILVPMLSAGCMLLGIGSKSASPAGNPSRGIIENNVYTNEYADLKFTAPDGWSFATDEEMAGLLGMSADSFGEPGMEFTKEMMDSDGVHDMLAMDLSTGSNIFVMIAKTPGLSETQFLSLLKIRQKGENSNVVYQDIADEQIGSVNYKVLQSDDGDSMQYYYVRNIDDFIIFMTITVSYGFDVSAIIDCFSDLHNTDL